ncbi:MAG: 2-C-methyl-D-erythritol 2,4-cyclodiphosphate synthase [Nitrospinae bacterium]|nr:2-C-methyl-D-erythritol 2,4-cyclodiphosphate synthase [Nitrospinota bacterium]
MRVGHGFDVHRFAEGRPLWLCGVRLEHPRGLEGHSDADVALHAVCDALLGAASLGDIGQMFPDSDAAYKGVSSVTLLARVAERLAREGWRVANVDVTIAAQEPRVAPHREAMRHALAGALGMDTGAVSVKATTTEGLGFTGRREGIAAWAVALVEK